MSHQRHRGKKEHHGDPETPRNYLEEAYEVLPTNQVFNAAAKLTPTQLHRDLRRTCENLLSTDSIDFHGRSKSMFITPESIAKFIRQLRSDGLINAVMSNVANDHADSKGVSRGDLNLVPDHSVIWPVIRHVLANPSDCGRWDWLEIALLSAETYATDRDEAARLLVDYIRTDSLATQIVREMCPNSQEFTERPITYEEARNRETAHAWCVANFVRNSAVLAAISLSKLAPQTPGLVDVLIDGLSHDWFVSLAINDREIGGAGIAAEAIARLGPQGQKALPLLREAVLSDWNWLSANDRRMAFETYTILCQDPSAMRELLNEIETRKNLMDEIPMESSGDLK